MSFIKNIEHAFVIQGRGIIVVGQHKSDLALGDVLQEVEGKVYLYKIIGISQPYPNRRHTVDYLIEIIGEDLDEKSAGEVAEGLIGKSLMKVT